MQPLKNSFIAFLPLLIVSQLIIPASHAEDRIKNLRGEAFTDPSHQVKMPADWINKPIKYEQSAEKSDIVVVLEQDVYQTIIPLIQQYAREQKLRIRVKEGTCGIAAGALARKTADIGGFCCPAGKEDRLPGLKFHTLGIVSKAFFVHPDNPVENVPLKQLRDIFRGTIYKWSELKTQKGLPAPDRMVRAVGRLHCQTRPGHWRLLLDNDKLFSPRLFEVGSIPDMIAQVAADKDSIGWEALSMVERYKNIGKVKVIKVDGYSPKNLEAIALLKYPLYRTYNITTWEGKTLENQKAQKLVAYLIKEVEHLSAGFGFVPSSRLRKAGWKFKGNELTGEPLK